VNDIISAIGLVQLERLPSFIERRREIHAQYDGALAGIDGLLTPPPIPAEATSTYYFYWLQTAPEKRDELALFLRERGIYTTFRYHPLHLVRHYRSDASLPVAERVMLSTVCIPIHQAMADDDVTQVVDAIREFYGVA
jgi:aminotransferase